MASIAVSSRPGDKGKVDPLLSRGVAISQQLAYFWALPNDPREAFVKEVMVAANWKRLKPFMSSRDQRLLQLPTVLGGLNYPTDKTFSQFWRKISSIEKKVLSAIISPDVTQQAWMVTHLLSTTARPSKRGEQLNIAVLDHIIQELGKPIRDAEGKREWQCNLTKGEGLTEDFEPGLITKQDIILYPDTTTDALAPHKGADKKGLRPTDSQWAGHRNLRLQISRLTDLIPFHEVVDDLLQENLYEQMWTQSTVPPTKILRFPTYKKQFAACRKYALQVLGSQVNSAPRFHPSSFDDIKFRIADKSILYVDRKNPACAGLFQKTHLKLVEPD